MKRKKAIKLRKLLNTFFNRGSCSYKVIKIQIINNELIFSDKNSNLKKLQSSQFYGYIGFELNPDEIILEK